MILKNPNTYCFLINTDYNGTYLIIYTDSCSISLTKPWMLKLLLG